MASFGTHSEAKLATCHFILVGAARIVIQVYDHRIVHGWRGEDVQDALLAEGATTKPWPKSLHNHMAKEEGDPLIFDEDGVPLSLALDFGPWVEGRIPWDDREAFLLIAGAYRGVLADMGVRCRLGADWDSDGITHDQRFHDLGHVEFRGMLR